MNVLIIAGYEICFNPRLIKAGDAFKEQGYDIYAITPVIGLANPNVYKDFIHSRNWNFIEINVSKNSFRSKITWLYISIVNLIYKSGWKLFKLKFGFEYVLCKPLIGVPKNEVPKNIDLVLTNLIDCLPYAAKISKSYNANLIFDSQEYFSGQYNKATTWLKTWVIQAERNYIVEASVVLATTNVMKSKLMELYNISNIIRVRNIPYYPAITKSSIKKSYDSLKLVWHGFKIFYNTRGINIIIDALFKCKVPVELTLQGYINEDERRKIEEIAIGYNIQNKITIRQPALPEKIVDSLISYDIGLIGELPLEENQLLTSSNKLFDYIHAGLAVISSNMPGIMETIREYKIGDIYNAGDSDALANNIGELFINQQKLNLYKEKAREASDKLLWPNDFNKVFKYIK